MIVGISGHAGAGKDTLADLLVHEYGFVKIGLADPLKRICQEVYQFSDDQLWGPSEKRNAPDLRYPTGRGHLSPRIALQTLGTEWARAAYVDTWVDYAVRTAQLILEKGYEYDPKRGAVRPSFLTKLFDVGAVGVVFSDVRFKNEMNKIRSMGKGHVIRIKRPGATGGVGVPGHSSEEEQKTISDLEFDHVIDNSGPLTSLAKEVEIMFNRLPLNARARAKLPFIRGDKR